MGTDRINQVPSATPLTGVMVDIDYMESTPQGDACHCSHGHLCQDWDHAERYRLDFELTHPEALITHVDMAEKVLSPFTYEAIRLPRPDEGGRRPPT
jgi:hypothetical protein